MAKHIAFSSRASGRCEEELGASSHTCTGKLSCFPVTQEMRCQTIPHGRQMKWETKAICTFRSVGNCLVYPCAFPGVSDLPSPSFCGSLHTPSHQALLLSCPPFPVLLSIIMRGLLTLADHFCWSGFDDKFSHVWEDLWLQADVQLPSVCQEDSWGTGKITKYSLLSVMTKCQMQI